MSKYKQRRVNITVPHELYKSARLDAVLKDVPFSKYIQQLIIKNLDSLPDNRKKEIQYGTEKKHI